VIWLHVNLPFPLDWSLFPLKLFFSSFLYSLSSHRIRRMLGLSKSSLIFFFLLFFLISLMFHFIILDFYHFKFLALLLNFYFHYRINFHKSFYYSFS
jgi:hypothetical protein